MIRPAALIVAAIFFTASIAFAEDIYTPPTWRGQGFNVYLSWTFPTDANPAAPDDSINGNDIIAQMVLGEFTSGWVPQLAHDTKYGLWDLGRYGTMTVQLPQLQSGFVYDTIHVGVLYFVDMHCAPAVDVEFAEQITEGKSQLVQPSKQAPGSWQSSYTQWNAGDGSARAIVITADYYNSLIDSLQIDIQVSSPFTIPGDATLDCSVDMADLIYVRNRLGQDAGTDAEWQADVNSDGVIDIRDLVYVRNRTGNVCENED